MATLDVIETNSWTELHRFKDMFTVKGLLCDNKRNIIYFLGLTICYRYYLNSNQYERFKCPQPLFGTSCFVFLPGSDKTKLIVIDSNSMKYDYLYIYNILQNQLEFKTIAALPSRIGSDKYQIIISSVLQNHDTLSQIQFIYVINNSYNYNNKQKLFIPMDIIKILSKYYYNVYCHIVGDGYYIQYNISPVYYCMDYKDDNKKSNYSYYAQTGFGKYVNDLNKESFKINRFHNFFNRKLVTMESKLLMVHQDILCLDLNTLDTQGIESPNISHLQEQKQQTTGIPGTSTFANRPVCPFLQRCNLVQINNSYLVIFGGEWSYKNNYDTLMSEYIRDIYYSDANTEEINWKKSTISLPEAKSFVVCATNQNIYLFDGPYSVHEDAVLYVLNVDINRLFS